MHLGCFSFFECCQLANLTENSVPSILDIGSYDINGSLKYLFPNSDYTGVDLAEGPNVDVVESGDKYNTDKRYDITLSCECFEHNPQYLQTFQNMIYLTKANGLVVFTCATTGRPEHGTKNTSPHSSLASQEVSSDYYKNLVKEDFDQCDLNAIFSSYSFYTNTYSNDLYFIGRKLGSENKDTLPSVAKVDGVPQILELASKLHYIENSFSSSSNEVIQELIDEVYSNYTLSNLLLTRLMGYLILLGDYDKALKFGELASGYHFNQVANLVFQARCHFKKGNFEQANELMIEVSNLPQVLNPKNAVMMAGIENKLFGSERALVTINKSLRIFPNEKESIWRLYLWSKKIGQIEEANEALAKMIELHPSDKRLERVK